MKLSIPVVVGDKTLLDAGAVISSENLLDKVKANGVTKLDVHKAHIRELSEKYPEFYGNQGEAVAKAKESGRQKRVALAEEWAMARKLNPRAPFVTLLAGNKDLPDLSKLLVPYFQVEQEGSRFREVADKITRSKLILLWVDGFTSEKLSFIRNHLKNELDHIGVLAISRDFTPSHWPSVRWLRAGESVFRAAFLSIYPVHAEAFSASSLAGVSLPAIKKPVVQIISHGPIVGEADEIVEAYPGIDFRVFPFEEAKFKDALFAIYRAQNKDQNLIAELKELFGRGYPPGKLLIAIETLSNEELVALSKVGKLLVQVGPFLSQKVKAVLDKIAPAAPE